MLQYLWHFEGNTVVTLAVTLPALVTVFVRSFCEFRSA